MNRKGSEKEKWQAGQQQAGEGNEVESGQGLGQALIVPGESPETCCPGEGAFDDPPAWQQDEPVLGFRVFDDFQSDAVRLGRFGRIFASVALVRIGQFHRFTGDRLHLASELLHLLPLLSRGRGDHQGQQVPQRVHRHMRLGAALLLVPIIASPVPALGRGLQRSTVPAVLRPTRP